MAKTRIYYIIDLKNKQIYAFDSFVKAEKKQDELGFVDAPQTIKDLQDKTLSKHWGKLPRCPYESKELKSYYGTVWFRYEFTESGCCRYHIAGRQKDLGLVSEGEKTKKIVLVPYNEYMHPKEESPEEKGNLKVSLDLIDNSDVTKMFNSKNYKYRSPE